MNGFRDAEPQAPINEVDRLAEESLGYLETAALIVDDLIAYSRHQKGLVKPFDLPFMSAKERDEASAYGHKLITKAKQELNKNMKSARRLAIPQPLMRLVNENVDINRNDAEVMRQDTSDALEQLPIDHIEIPDSKPELDEFVRRVAELSLETPSLTTLYVSSALTVLGLTQFFSRPEVPEKVAMNRHLPAFFKTAPAQGQAIYLTVPFFAKEKDANYHGLGRTLHDIYTGVGADGEPLNDYHPVVNDSLTNAIMVEARCNLGYFRDQIVGRFVIALDKSLANASALAYKLIKEADLTDNDSHGATEEHIPEALLALEAKVAERSRLIASQAAQISDRIHNILYEQYFLKMPDVNFPDFPVAETVLADEIKRAKAAEAAGALAAAQAQREAAMHELVQELTSELEMLQRQFLMSRAELKKIPDSNSLTSKLVRGEVGNQDGTAEPISKEDAFEVASFAYQLNKLTDGGDIKVVYDSLFEALEKEAMLRRQLGAQASQVSISRPFDWLVKNVNYLGSSDLATLRNIDRSFRAYKGGGRVLSGREQPMRMISSATIQAIELVRQNAALLEIKAFPPGVSNAEELEEDALDLATRPGSRIATLDFERLLHLNNLAIKFNDAGYKSQLFRLLPGTLREYFPYYALVIEDSLKKVVVAENPRTTNATYVLEEVDPDFATWQEIVQLDKGSAKELGSRAMTHNAMVDTAQHFDRVTQEVLRRFSQ